jgi:uncharacterized membrane protein
MNKSVFAITKDLTQTQTIIEELIEEGFAETEISVIAPDNAAEHSLGAVKETKAPEGATTGATTGGIVGGVLGLLAGIGALAIPGVGPFVAAGPIMAALSGLGIGAATGGIVGGLIGLGIPEYEAKVYGDKLKTGNYLLSVHARNSEEVDLAKNIFEDNEAEDIATTNLSDHDSKKVDPAIPIAD